MLGEGTVARTVPNMVPKLGSLKMLLVAKILFYMNKIRIKSNNLPHAIFTGQTVSTDSVSCLLCGFRDGNVDETWQPWLKLLTLIYCLTWETYLLARAYRVEQRRM